MPRRNNRDETTGRRGERGAVKRKVMDMVIPQRCPCWYGEPCAKHPEEWNQ